MDTSSNEATVELFDIPVASIHVNDELPELVAALIAYEAQDWVLAKAQLEAIAKTGNRLALFKFANALDNLGDLAGAEHFWRLAVAGGDTNAANNLANLLDDDGRRQEALGLYEVAANAGSHDAMLNIGLCVEDEDPSGAEEWFLKSVEAGGSKACANLALKYFDEGLYKKAKEYVELGFARGSLLAVTAEARYYLAKEDWEQTLKAVDRAILLSNDDNLDDQVHPRKMRVIALIYLLQFERAEIALEEYRLLDADGANELASWLEQMREAHLEGGEASAPSKVPSIVLAKFCGECGTAFSDHGARFCPACGNARAVTAEPSVPEVATRLLVPTTFEQKLFILSELWLDHRKDEAFADFIEYNDIGLPLAYALHHGIVNTTDKATNYIEETFALLLDSLDVEDREGGFETFAEILELEDDSED